MTRNRRVVLTAAMVISLTFLFSTAFAETGVTEDTILIGTSQGLSGSMAFAANQNVVGMKIMIDEINGKGGIHGRKIKLIEMDDNYRSDRAIANARRMIENDKVFAFVMNLGTHTVAATLPLLNQHKVPLFFCATESKVFNGRALCVRLEGVLPSHADPGDSIHDGAEGKEEDSARILGQCLWTGAPRVGRGVYEGDRAKAHGRGKIQG